MNWLYLKFINNLKKLFLIIGFFILKSSFGQGCSDAGFCTMGSMRPGQSIASQKQLKLKTLELGTYYGRSNIGDVITSVTLDFNMSLNSKNAFQFKTPYLYVDGLLANTHGLGDISLSYTRQLLVKKNILWATSVGTKIPTNDASKTTNDLLPLPNYYQTSLGTYDFILGTSVLIGKWMVATGVQHPFNKNNNQFIWGPWNKTSDSAVARLYPVSKKLLRGTDVMIRLERSWFYHRFTHNIGLLGIYRLTKDEFYNPKDILIVQEGTVGMMMSAVGGFSYKLNVHHILKLGGAMRVYMQRYQEAGLSKVSLDGLTRKGVVTLGYEYKF